MLAPTHVSLAIKKLSSSAKRRRLRIQLLREASRIAAKAAEARRRWRPNTKAAANRVLTVYARGARLQRSARDKNQARIELPPTFSFIDNPDDTLSALASIVDACRGQPGRRVFVSQTRCTLVDHCAESTAAALVLEARRGLKISFWGEFPKDPAQRSIVMATGIPRALLGNRLGEPAGFLRFNLFKGRKGSEGALRSTQRDLVSTRLTEYVDRCLAVGGVSLSEPSAERLAGLVSEVIGNAEDHGQSPEWWVGAYLREVPGLPYRDCHLTIFNFGETMAASLQRLPPDARLRREIEELVVRHGTQRLFSTDWTEESLWTLYALQGGISRFNSEREVIGDRGQGTADMLEFFQYLGQRKGGEESPRMCLVSGRTHILFDNSYKMVRDDHRGGPARRIIALNASNDFNLPPDPRAVRRLKQPFPGTLISLRFFIDPAHLTKLRVAL